MTSSSLTRNRDVISSAGSYSPVDGFVKCCDGPACYRVLLAVKFTADVIPLPKVIVCHIVVAHLFIVDRHVYIEPVCRCVILTNYSKGKRLCFFVNLQSNQQTDQKSESLNDYA